mmetsp:Transcript_12524/g.41810  ORF Transcript_12524/g.41810 Transcript_12524/m.41810 type:complete len:89 (+) Transcript_12524:33-299(+)
MSARILGQYVVSTAVCLGIGFVSLEAIAPTPKTPPAAPEHRSEFATEQQDKVQAMIAAAKTGTTKNNIEAAYDGAVKTHDFGFPPPKK